MAISVGTMLFLVSLTCAADYYDNKAKEKEPKEADNTSSVTFGGANRGKIVTGVDALKSSAMKPTAQGRKQQVERNRGF